MWYRSIPVWDTPITTSYDIISIDESALLRAGIKLDPKGCFLCFTIITLSYIYFVWFRSNVLLVLFFFVKTKAAGSELKMISYLRAWIAMEMLGTFPRFPPSVPGNLERARRRMNSFAWGGTVLSLEVCRSWWQVATGYAVDLRAPPVDQSWC